MTDTSVTFSPDGGSVAIYRRPVQEYGDGSVLVVDLKTKAERTIATGRFSELTWSPDGASIAAIGERVIHDHDDNGYPYGLAVAWDLWLLKADASPAVRLSYYDPGLRYSGGASFCATSGGYVPRTESPQWSRDGRLAFLSNHEHLTRYGRVYDVLTADLTGAGNNQIVYHSPPDTCVGNPRIYGDAQTVYGGSTLLYGWA